MSQSPHTQPESDIPQEKAFEDIRLSPILSLVNEFNGRFHKENLESMFQTITNRHEAKTQREANSDKVSAKIERQREREFERLQGKFRKRLARTGLGVELARPYGEGGDESEAEDNNNYYPLELSGTFKIDDANKFLSYLDAIIERKLRVKGEAEALVQIVFDLAMELDDHYDVNNPSDRTINMLSTFPKVLERVKTMQHMGFFKRLEADEAERLDWSTSSLELFVRLSKRKLLREYLLASRADILQEGDVELADDGTFALKDSGYVGIQGYCRDPRLFREHAEKAVRVVLDMRGNPNALDVERFLTKRLEKFFKDVKTKFVPIDGSGIYKMDPAKITETHVVADEMYDRLLEA